MCFSNQITRGTRGNLPAVDLKKTDCCFLCNTHRRPLESNKKELLVEGGLKSCSSFPWRCRMFFTDRSQPVRISLMDPDTIRRNSHKPPRCRSVKRFANFKLTWHYVSLSASLWSFLWLHRDPGTAERDVWLVFSELVVWFQQIMMIQFII